MQVSIGNSKNKNAKQAIDEALKGTGAPKLVIFLSPYDMLESVTATLKQDYPETLSIGTSGTHYFGGKASDQELIIIAFGQDADVSVGVMRNLSTCPVADINTL